MHLIAIVEILTQVLFINHALKTNKPRFWIIILLIPWVGFLIYLFYGFTADSPSSHDGNEDPGSIPLSALPADYKLTYIAQGKVFQALGDSSVEEIQSPFGQKIIDQTVKINQKNEWKTKSTGTGFGGSLLWGTEAFDAEAIKVKITSVTSHKANNNLFYMLETESTGGLFSYNHQTKEEVRLFHKERFKAKDLDIHPEAKEFVCAQQFANGTSNIVLISDDGNDLREITEGDSIDESPSWILGKHRRILFQSSGIARNSGGYAVGRGAASIQALDLDNSQMTTVLEDERYDFLQPHISVDGFLYYIRRPYEKKRYRPETAVLDFILFPFRLLRAVFHYLNFFSLVYSKKPLTTAGGPKVEGDDIKTIMVKGRVIDAEKALRCGVKIMGVPSLVPSSWELIKRDENNREEIIAKNVASFDVGQDGTIIYSNGYGVFKLTNEKSQGLLLRDKLIEDIVIE